MVFEVQIAVLLLLYTNFSARHSLGHSYLSGWQLNFIYLQFWMSFFSLVCLVYSCLQFFSTVGSSDLLTVYFFYSSVRLVSTGMLLGVLFSMLGIFIKLGLFPFFF